jgi:regulation of enolase protein 1 (concanavalin A-like superfamily)
VANFIDRRALLTAACGSVWIPALARARVSEQERWLNEPGSWSRNGTVLTMRAEPKTDFWRKTYFGYVTDNGHLVSRPLTGDFQATVNVAGAFASQYDQAGLMVRLDPTCWMKCGVEYVDGVQNVSSVFTRDFSDWAGVPRDSAAGSMWFRLARKGSALTFSFSLDGETYREVRQGHLTAARTVQVGVMAAAPEGAGFTAIFRDLTIVPATQAGS